MFNFDDFLDWCYDLTYLALKILPDSPFEDLTYDIYYDFPAIGNVMASINYFVPVDKILQITILYIAACATYITVRYVLRMTRFIQ